MVAIKNPWTSPVSNATAVVVVAVVCVVGAPLVEEGMDGIDAVVAGPTVVETAVEQADTNTPMRTRRLTLAKVPALSQCHRHRPPEGRATCDVGRET
jgi:hypothetical protein